MCGCILRTCSSTRSPPPRTSIRSIWISIGLSVQWLSIETLVAHDSKFFSASSRPTQCTTQRSAIARQVTNPRPCVVTGSTSQFVCSLAVSLCDKFSNYSRGKHSKPYLSDHKIASYDSCASNLIKYCFFLY